MKFLVSILFLMFSCLSLTAMANEPGMNMPKAEQMNLKEGDVLEIVMTVNKNEINAAKLALEKTSNLKVKQFAQLMQTDHSKNLRQTKVIAEVLKIEPVPSPISNALRDNGKKELAKLNDLKGKAFDLAYMNAMVKGHQAVLDIVTNKLIPNTKNPKLESHLQTTKMSVEHHLEMAKSTLDSLK